MLICFTDVFFVFFVFFCFFAFFRPSATKIPDTRSRERLNGFSCRLLPRIAMQQRTYWCRRLANDSELVCWLWHCAATAVALQRHERVNAFNLVNDVLTKNWLMQALPQYPAGALPNPRLPLYSAGELPSPGLCAHPTSKLWLRYWFVPIRS